MNAATRRFRSGTAGSAASAAGGGSKQSGNGRGDHHRANELGHRAVAQREQVHVVRLDETAAAAFRIGVAASRRSAKLPNDWLIAYTTVPCVT